VTDGKRAIKALKYAQQSDVTTALIGRQDRPHVRRLADHLLRDRQTGDQLVQLGEVFATAPQGFVVAKNDAASPRRSRRGCRAHRLRRLLQDPHRLGQRGRCGEDRELNPAVS